MTSCNCLAAYLNSTSWPHFVNSQLLCLLPIGILQLVIVILKVLFCWIKWHDFELATGVVVAVVVQFFSFFFFWGGGGMVI